MTIRGELPMVPPLPAYPSGGPLRVLDTVSGMPTLAVVGAGPKGIAIAGKARALAAAWPAAGEGHRFPLSGQLGWGVGGGHGRDDWFRLAASSDQKRCLRRLGR